MKIRKATDSLILRLLLYLYLLITFMPIVAYYVPSFVKIVLAVAIWLYYIIPYFSFKWIPLFGIPFLTLLFSIGSNSNPLSYAYFLVNMATIAALFWPLTMEKNEGLSKRVVALIIISFIINATTTYIGNLVFPGASRELASMQAASDAYETYLSYNIGGFDVIYTLSLSIPVLAILFKNSKATQKFLILIVTIIFIMAIIQSQYTLALIIALFSIILFILPYNSKRFFLVAIIVLAIILLNAPFVFTIIKTVSGSENVELRLSDFLTWIQGSSMYLESDISMRSEKYSMSINGFLSSPFLGNFLSGKRVDGGHSFVLDSACQFGVIGLVLIIWMYRTIWVSYLKRFQKCKFYVFVKVFFVEYIIVTILNPQEYIPFISFALPLVLVFIARASQNCERK